MSKQNLNFDPFSRREYAPRYQGLDYAFRTINRKFTNDNSPRPLMKQRSIRAKRFDVALENISSDQRDIYASCSHFKTGKNRTVGNVCAMTQAFSDLDFHKIVEERRAAFEADLQARFEDGEIGIEPDQLRFKAPSIESVCDELRMHCRDEGIPYPSVICSSGRGFYVKWFFTKPIPLAAACRYKRLMDVIEEKFKKFGSDPLAKSPSQVLRVMGTVNSKNGATSRLAWVNFPMEMAEGTPDEEKVAQTYDFEFLYRELVGERRQWVDYAEQRRKQREEAEATGEAVSVEKRSKAHLMPEWDEYYWLLLQDIGYIAEQAFGQTAIPEGHRDAFLFAAAICLSHSKMGRFERELEVWVQTRLPGVSREDIAGKVCTIKDKINAYTRGERVRFGGKDWTPLYTPKKSWFLEALGVVSRMGQYGILSASEWKSMQPGLLALIDKTEKSRRAVERKKAKRHAEGSLPKAEHVAKLAEDRNAKIAEAVALRDQGMTYPEIAAAMGVAPVTVKRLMKEARSMSVPAAEVVEVVSEEAEEPTLFDICEILGEAAPEAEGTPVVVETVPFSAVEQEDDVVLWERDEDEYDDDDGYVYEDDEPSWMPPSDFAWQHANRGVLREYLSSAR